MSNNYNNFNNYNNNSNNRGGRGGGGGRGRGRGRGGGHGGGGHGGGDSNAYKSKLRPCKAWTTTGACSNQSCKFAHVVKLHASIDASSMQQQHRNNNNNYRGSNNNNNNNNNRMHSVSAAAIWENNGAIKIFTGSHDGFWRLWNTQGGTFVKEFEQSMGAGKIECLKVCLNHLFCGFEGMSPHLPNVLVGMVHAWNLGQPTQPPLEFHMQPGLIPYAHAQAVTDLMVMEAAPQPTVVSGSRDGSIKMWSLDSTSGQFVLSQKFLGHAREITGLTGVGTNLLWSSATDACIRIWDYSKTTGPGNCQHAITSSTNNSNAPNSQQQQQQPPNNGNNNNNPMGGHTNAVTSLLAFNLPNDGGTFVLSSALDGYVKAWNGNTGQCVANEYNWEGVVSMSLLSADLKGNPLLLIGLESGNIIVRNILQTSTTPAFSCLFTLSSIYTASHQGGVLSLCQGPGCTFYSTGQDGKLMVWQLTGDLGL